MASGTAPVPADPHRVPDPRYDQMAGRFGIVTHQQLTCGAHVHVSVESLDEAVGVLDRIRVWLPCLLALSANSPYWQGMDTGYESYRSQAIGRWPVTGPSEPFGSAAAYRALVDRLIATGVLLDRGKAGWLLLRPDGYTAAAGTADTDPAPELARWFPADPRPVPTLTTGQEDSHGQM